MKPIAPTINVTVIFALPERATEIPVTLPVGATVADALECSGLANRHPEVDVAGARVGIFGKLADRKAKLGDGDRIEVYRALVAEPKDSRLRRAARRPKPTQK